MQDTMDALVAPAEATGPWERTGWKIGTEIAAPAANDVDRNARFPQESLDAMREARLLSAMIPTELGGGGASLGEMVGAVRALAGHCASSALVLAMHNIEIFNLIRHGMTPGLQALAREIASDQLLIANANSEVGLGGDVGRSICALRTESGIRILDKEALAISYGENADLIVATARRGPEVQETDQVFVAYRKSDFTLDPISGWDTLGLRGTGSRGFRLHASVDPDLVFPVDFSVIANDGGGQARQLLLSAVWVGLAEAAAAKAHTYVRAAARKSIGTLPPSALRLSEIAADLLEGRTMLASLCVRFNELESSSNLDDVGFTIALRNLKVKTSTMALRVSTAALGICGIAGYQRESPYSLDRIIRDANGGLIMVSNERYLLDNAQLLLARKNI